MQKNAGDTMEVHTLWNETTLRNDTDATHFPAFLIFNCTVLTLSLVLGLPGNLWVCWVVFRTKSLQNCNNALLVSLAASDLLKCAVDTPLLLFSFLCQGKDSRVSVCALQQFTYALCSCVQLLTLVSISVERFQAIAFPFQTERRKARVRLWITSIWACGLVLAIISLTLSKKALFYMLCRSHFGGSGGDLRHTDPFGPYVLVPVWGLSLTVIVVHYVRIFKVVRQHRKKVFNRGVQLRPTVAEHVWAWLSVPPSAPRTAPRGSCRSLPLSPLPLRRTMLLVAEAGAPCAGVAAARPPEIVGAVCLLTPGAKERGKKQMEGKLAQRFGYIIIAFTLFWAPMVVILLMNVISWPDRLLMELETSAVVLTCVQAAVDPLIYTFVTRQFRTELSKILSSIPGCPPKPRG
ncbi:5-hydroxytryptamine receptor 1-like [Amphiprion ocellaris]|uniref:5-hydroxytryptamine receptor 1-like n=1 Tax=Amphiprion ocellaris TaxID=80972 RepID=UPI000C3016C4|nr:5-hydroxytryptamine receptor 1-like [Amphiprion ocellaris]